MEPESNIVSEASRLLDAARARALPLRLIGGTAVRLSITDREPVLTRPYKDIDLVTIKGGGRSVGAFMEAMGYRPDKSFNAAHGQHRLLFYDDPNARQVDVFVGAFEMCHRIPITDRIELLPYSVPLAELLLTKLQIVELNPKDHTDILTVLYHHEVAEGDDEQINSARVAELCAADWGLWRTTKMNIERVGDGVPASGLPEAAQQVVGTRLTELWSRVELEPKSRKWRRRNRLGDMVRWYEQPDEVT